MIQWLLTLLLGITLLVTIGGILHVTRYLLSLCLSPLSEKYNSTVLYFNDVALSNGDMTSINECTECQHLYSNYVRHDTYPCPQCGDESKKLRSYAKLYGLNTRAYLVLVRTTRYWQKVDNYGNPFTSAIYENEQLPISENEQCKI